MEYNEVSEVIRRILSRIKEDWAKYKDKLHPDFTFENYRDICLLHLDLASKKRVPNYKIGLAMVDEARRDEEVLRLEKIIKNKEIEIKLLDEKIRRLILGDQVIRSDEMWRIGRKDD